MTKTVCDICGGDMKDIHLPKIGRVVVKVRSSVHNKWVSKDICIKCLSQELALYMMDFGTHGERNNND